MCVKASLYFERLLLLEAGRLFVTFRGPVTYTLQTGKMVIRKRRSILPSTTYSFVITSIYGVSGSRSWPDNSEVLHPRSNSDRMV